jgi:hypothetical protein
VGVGKFLSRPRTLTMGAQYQQVVPMLRGLNVGGEKRIISEHSHITEPAGNTPSADKVCQQRLLRTLTWTSSQIGRWQRVGQVWAIHFGFPQRLPGLSAMVESFSSIFRFKCLAQAHAWSTLHSCASSFSSRISTTVVAATAASASTPADRGWLAYDAIAQRPMNGGNPIRARGSLRVDITEVTMCQISLIHSTIQLSIHSIIIITEMLFVPSSQHCQWTNGASRCCSTTGTSCRCITRKTRYAST